MLRIYIMGGHPKLRDWVFNRRNINRIAYEYDAKVEHFDLDIKSARLRLHTGPMMFVEHSTVRACKLCGHEVF